MSKREYTRLTRARRRITGGVISVGAGYASLWLGSDHVLCIDSTGFSEEYKRFYFRDIQAFTMRRTARRSVQGILIALPLMLFLMGVLGSYDNPDNAVGFWLCAFFAAFLGVLLLYNFLAGPTVRCYLQTAVQTEELPPLNRWRRANKAISRLRPLIAAAQGELLREEIPDRLQAAMAEAAAAPPPAGEAPPLINP